MAPNAILKIKFKRCKNDLRCNNLIVTPKDFQRSRNWDMALGGRSQTTFKEVGRESKNVTFYKVESVNQLHFTL